MVLHGASSSHIALFVLSSGDPEGKRLILLRGLGIRWHRPSKGAYPPAPPTHALMPREIGRKAAHDLILILILNKTREPPPPGLPRSHSTDIWGTIIQQHNSCTVLTATLWGCRPAPTRFPQHSGALFYFVNLGSQPIPTFSLSPHYSSAGVALAT